MTPIFRESVDEDEAGVRPSDDGCQLAMPATWTRLKTRQAVTHVTFQLSPRDEGRHRVDTRHRWRRTEPATGYLERLLARSGCEIKSPLILTPSFSAYFASIACSASMYRDPAIPLRLGHDVERQCRLS
jgi:hypothetical protein